MGIKLTKAQHAYLEKLVISIQYKGKGPTLRVQRALVKKGLARWGSNKNLIRRCGEKNADFLIINGRESFNYFRSKKV